jgi:hypothetical protein
MYSVTYFFKWLLHKDMNYGIAEAKCHCYHHCFLGYRLYASQSIGLLWVPKCFMMNGTYNLATFLYMNFRSHLFEHVSGIMGFRERPMILELSIRCYEGNRCSIGGTTIHSCLFSWCSSAHFSCMFCFPYPFVWYKMPFVFS